MMTSMRRNRDSDSDAASDQGSGRHVPNLGVNSLDADGDAALAQLRRRGRMVVPSRPATLERPGEHREALHAPKFAITESAYLVLLETVPPQGVVRS